MRYRKKPVVIEAVRLPYHEWADNPLEFEEVPEWLKTAVLGKVIVPVFKGEDYWYYQIETLEGTLTAKPSDMLIRGVEGELYFCEAGIFRKTYEPVDTSEVSEITEKLRYVLGLPTSRIHTDRHPLDMD